jgi:hypothetical protein
MISSSNELAFHQKNKGFSLFLPIQSLMFCQLVLTVWSQNLMFVLNNKGVLQQYAAILVEPWISANEIMAFLRSNLNHW